MRSQCAVFIDAGYLLAAAATRVTGTSLRSGIEVDHRALVTALMRRAEEDSGLPMLRANWYDSGSRPNGLPDWTQEQIGLMPRVKLRLGRRSLSGEQKGVDLRIGLDLAGHGRERVADVIYLVSGDDDLTEAVEEAQSHGIQVNLLIVPNHAGRPQAVAKHLQRAADDVLLIAAEDIDLAVKNRSIPQRLLPRHEDSELAAGEGGPDAAATHVVAPPAEPPTPSPAEAQAPADEAGALTSGESLEEATADAAPAAQEDADESAPAPAPAPVAVDAGYVDAERTAIEQAIAAVGETSETDQPAPITPNVFASRKSTTVIPPKAPTSIAWSSTGGGSMQEGNDSVNPEDVDAVARQVVEGWCRMATPSELADLRAHRPTIPGDLDRALLMDLSTRIDLYDIPEGARFVLRDRFWQLIDKVKLG